MKFSESATSNSSASFFARLEDEPVGIHRLAVAAPADAAAATQITVNGQVNGFRFGVGRCCIIEVKGFAHQFHNR